MRRRCLRACRRAARKAVLESSIRAAVEDMGDEERPASPLSDAMVRCGSGPLASHEGERGWCLWRRFKASCSVHAGERGMPASEQGPRRGAVEEGVVPSSTSCGDGAPPSSSDGPSVQTEGRHDTEMGTASPSCDTTCRRGVSEGEGSADVEA